MEDKFGEKGRVFIMDSKKSSSGELTNCLIAQR